MKIKQTIVLAMSVMVVCGVLLSPVVVNAATCGGVSTSIIQCSQTGSCSGGENPFEGTDPKSDTTKTTEYSTKYGHTYGMCKNNVAPSVGVEDSGVWGLLLLVINIMTAGVGIMAVAGIVYGSVMYSAAGDSAEKVSKARAIIRNVVIGMIAYALMYAGLNFLIPGGLFQ